MTRQFLGLYPVVDSSDWIKKLVTLGVKTIQLRIKEPKANLEDEILKSIVLAEKYGALLFVNDYWQLAIRYGAPGVHLGQGDLDTADIEAIYKAGIKLGISTHCPEEVARAAALQPYYLACGPIYSTTSKMMPFEPQGIDRLKYWRRTLDFPLVAIGGINLQRIPEVVATGVEGIALISAITQAADPLAATRDLLVAIERARHYV